MDGQADLMGQDEGAFSRLELKLEQEKMKLERERIALERERLEAMRERVNAEAALRVGHDGRMVMRLSSVALCAIICLLVGGILGAFSMSARHEQHRAEQERKWMARLQEQEAEQERKWLARSQEQERNRTARLQEVMQSLGVVEPAGAESNEVASASAPSAAPSAAPRPLQVKTVRPKGSSSDSGISLIVIQ